MNKYIKIIPLVLALLSAMSSCTDDYTDPNSMYGVEGENTVISLRLSAPDFTTRVSRADMSENDAYNVQTLWIGIYSSSSGSSTLTASGNGLFMTNGQHGFSAGKKSHDRYTVTDINTKSGSSYIVAVANPDRNTGYKMNADGTPGPETSLLDLLRSASTWDEFRSIVIKRELFQNAANLEMPNATVNPLPMSGIYVDGASNADVADWTAVEPYYIPRSDKGVTLSGSIHLRRPYTQVKFNLSVDPVGGKDIVNLEPMSYTVHNVPTYSWLYERAQRGDDSPASAYDYANAGDPMNKNASENKNYLSSLTYTSTDIATLNGVSSFDFWLMENKRTGRADFCDGYQKREVEYKGDGGVNTGVYQSLCPTSGETLNNKATFVEIKCRLTYNRIEDVPIDVGGITAGDIKSRIVEATYIVHLGYVDGVATDFNNYRNSMYTYNVKVQSASNIIVEATQEGVENQPGAEGTVSDATDKMYELDSHYNVFNVQMTEEELQKFSFTIRSYYDNTEYLFGMKDNGDLIEGSLQIPNPGDENYRYYSWIEIMPTTGEDKLAPYPGVGKANTLGMIRGKSEELYNASTDGWFTVFVNEYTYEDEANNPGVETGGNWHKYINQPNRLAYLNVGNYVSSDKGSSYFLAKYGISQKSIQTYYDYTNAGVDNAVAVEYENETYGMDLRWPTSGHLLADGSGGYYPGVSYSNNDLSGDNGRYNVWTNSGGGYGNWTTYVQTGDAAKKTYGTVNNVNAIDNTNQTEGKGSVAKTYPVPQPVLLSGNNRLWSGDNNTQDVGDFDPQTNENTAQVIHAMHACMNRNRDNDGDGVIDANELRWYLPASGNYIRVIMGRNSLKSPILDYDRNPTLPYPASSGENSRLLLATSDFRMIWAFQGLSVSNFGTYGKSPWSVRCIRNLGTDMNEVTRQDPVEPAYEVIKGEGNYSTGGIVKVLHYYGTTLRNYTASPIAMHKVNSEENKLGQYGFEFAPRGNTLPQSDDEQSIGFASSSAYTDYVAAPTDCSELNRTSGRTGWRVPNQKELVIMMRGGAFTFNGYKYVMSSTMLTWTDDQPALSEGNSFNDRSVCAITRNLVTLNFEATSKLYNDINCVRCVRDLTPAEANKTYDQIRQNQ